VNKLFYLLVLFASVALANGDFVKPLKEAATRDELIKDFGTTIGFGEVEKWEFTTAGRKLMVFGYCPYSGRAACYVHAYYYNTTKRAGSFSLTGSSNLQQVSPPKFPATIR
jgi:hypothetical protein